MTGCFRVFQGVSQGVSENTLQWWLGCFFPHPSPVGGGKKKHPAHPERSHARADAEPKNRKHPGGEVTR